MTLELLVLAAIQLLAPPPSYPTARATEMAGWIAVAMTAEPPLFEGDDDRQREALFLVANAWHESRLRLDVQDCRVTGGDGQWFGLYQLTRAAMRLHTVREVCSDPVLQARLAIKHFAGARSRSPRGMITSFMGSWTASGRAREATYDRLLAALPEAPPRRLLCTTDEIATWWWAEL